VVSVFERRLEKEEAAIFSGLVAGRRPRFQDEVKRVFTESGTMHVLVASGSNIAFVAGLWYLLVRLIVRWPRTVALLSSLPAVWAYAFLAGLDAPILRAAIMATLGFIAHALGREDRAFHALGVAALGMLIVDPLLISDLGFRMSFLTVTGILLTLPRISLLIPPSWNLGRKIVQLLAASLVAEAWLVPITMGVFKRIYPMGLPANTLVVPL
jgi:competence protein ComEC